MTDTHDAYDALALARYLSGECSPDEAVRIERWAQEDPARVAELNAMHRTWSDAEAAPEWDADTLWRGMSARLPVQRARVVPLKPVRGAAEMAGAAGGRKSFRSWPTTRLVPYAFRWTAGLGMALGAVILLLGIGVFTYLTRLSSASRSDSAGVVASAMEVRTARGQRVTFRLPDQTLVTLAPMSHFRLAKDYGVRGRDVLLEGEAAFTVVHDPMCPFAVRTARTVTRDIGTRFVVRAYSDDAETDVVVAEGIVAVGRTLHVADTLVLTRGELARLAPDGQWTRARHVSLDRYFAWTEGRLVFQDVPLREVAVRLSRWYDIDIRLADPDIGVRSFDASFQTESATEAVRVVATTLNLSVTQTGRIYTLRAK